MVKELAVFIVLLALLTSCAVDNVKGKHNQELATAVYGEVRAGTCNKDQRNPPHCRVLVEGKTVDGWFQMDCFHYNQVKTGNTVIIAWRTGYFTGMTYGATAYLYNSEE